MPNFWKKFQCPLAVYSGLNSGSVAIIRLATAHAAFVWVFCRDVSASVSTRSATWDTSQMTDSPFSSLRQYSFRIASIISCQEFSS